MNPAHRALVRLIQRQRKNDNKDKWEYTERLLVPLFLTSALLVLVNWWQWYSNLRIGSEPKESDHDKEKDRYMVKEGAVFACVVFVTLALMQWSGQNMIELDCMTEEPATPLRTDGALVAWGYEFPKAARVLQGVAKWEQSCWAMVAAWTSVNLPLSLIYVLNSPWWPDVPESHADELPSPINAWYLMGAGGYVISLVIVLAATITKPVMVCWTKRQDLKDCLVDRLTVVKNEPGIADSINRILHKWRAEAAAAAAGPAGDRARILNDHDHNRPPDRGMIRDEILREVRDREFWIDKCQQLVQTDAALSRLWEMRNASVLWCVVWAGSALLVLSSVLEHMDLDDLYVDGLDTFYFTVGVLLFLSLGLVLCSATICEPGGKDGLHDQAKALGTEAFQHFQGLEDFGFVRARQEQLHFLGLVERKPLGAILCTVPFTQSQVGLTFFQIVIGIPAIYTFLKNQVPKLH